MRRTVEITLLVLLGLTGSSQAGWPWFSRPLDDNPAACPNCAEDESGPCDHRWSLTIYGQDHAHQLIEMLACGEACKRAEAVKKLGSRLHADYCSDPAVLTALLNALHCDPSWEVRRAAAGSLLGQNARVEPAILSLYVQSKADPHCLVRTRAAEALALLTLGHKGEYTELYAKGDRIVKALKEAFYEPGATGCQILLAQVFASCAYADLTSFPRMPRRLPAPETLSPSVTPQ
jgi:HEAT repeats